MPTINPNPAGFQFEVEKDTKTPPGTPTSVLPLVVIGYCPALAIATPTPVSEPGAAQTVGGRGPGVELSAGALDPNGRVSLVHMVNPGANNPGSYGALEQTWASPAAPVASVDLVELPDDDFDVRVLWTVGGSAPRYRVSVDGGLHYFAEQALGAATSITIPNGGGKINLTAPLAPTLARAADIRTKFLAHAAENGTFHGAADPNSPYTIPVPVDDATLLTCCAALKTSGLNHVDEVGGVHGAADATATTALTALVDPATRNEAVTFLEAFAAAFFGTGAANSGHAIRTTGGVHLAADNVNTLAGPAATLGTVTAGDTIAVPTNSPTRDATQLQAALASLRAYPGEFGTIVIAEPIPPAFIATIRDELVELWKRNKFPNVIAFFRRPNIGETATAYATALATLNGEVCVDLAMCSGATYHQSALINTADGKATPRRPQWWVAMAAARSEPEVDIQFVTPQQGVRIRDARGRILPGCLDEASGELYSVQARTIGTKTDTVRDPNGGVFVTQDLVLYDSNSDWILRAYSAVVNHALRASAPVVVYASTPPNGFPSAPAEPLDSESQASIKGDVDAVLQPELVGKRRCTQAAFSFVSSSAGVFSWKITIVPNTYPINGVRLKASVSLERVVN